jgi:hypothetical protein
MSEVATKGDRANEMMHARACDVIGTRWDVASFSTDSDDDDESVMVMMNE